MHEMTVSISNLLFLFFLFHFFPSRGHEPQAVTWDRSAHHVAAFIDVAKALEPLMQVMGFMSLRKAEIKVLLSTTKHSKLKLVRL